MSRSLLLHPEDLLKYEVNFLFYLTFTNYTLKYCVCQESLICTLEVLGLETSPFLSAAQLRRGPGLAGDRGTARTHCKEAVGGGPRLG